MRPVNWSSSKRSARNKAWSTSMPLHKQASTFWRYQPQGERVTEQFWFNKPPKASFFRPLTRTATDEPIKQREALDYHSRGRKGRLKSSLRSRTARKGPRFGLRSRGGGALQSHCGKQGGRLQLHSQRQFGRVITNGTAVLGLGDIGPEASKPVMEGRRAVQSIRRHRCV